MIGSDLKGKISLFIYVTGIALAFVRPWVADLIFALAAALWFVPDRRIEKGLARKD
jgi:hypothetical protein